VRNGVNMLYCHIIYYIVTLQRAGRLLCDCIFFRFWIFVTVIIFTNHHFIVIETDAKFVLRITTTAITIGSYKVILKERHHFK